MLQMISGLSSDKNGSQETGKSHIFNAEREKKSTHNSVSANILQEYGKLFIYSINKRKENLLPAVLHYKESKRKFFTLEGNNTG